MPYDEALATRLRQALDALGASDVVENRMFGGVGMMIDGNMCGGVHKDRLIVRVGPEAYERALAQPFAGELDITGRPMRGWVVVAPEGCRSSADLLSWAEMGLAFVRTLPPK